MLPPAKHQQHQPHQQHQLYHTMSCKENSGVEDVTPLQVQRQDIVNTVQSEPILSTDLHVKLSDGWVVKEGPRTWNPTYVDRNSTESGKGQQLCFSTAVDNSLLEENASTSTAIPKSAVKPGEKKVRAIRRSQNRANKPSSLAQKEIITPVSWKHSILSEKKPVKLQKNTNSEKNNTAPVHNLILPPPAKVTWVMSGSGSSWNAFVDGSAVTEAEKLKWSEAFVLSTLDNDGN